MDSPRGRISLMQAGLDGEPMTDAMVGHVDACLGCMACVTACPSGVQYDKLIEATRAQVERGTAARSPTGCSAGRSSRCSRTRGGSACCADRCASTGVPACRKSSSAAACWTASHRRWPRWRRSPRRCGRRRRCPSGSPRAASAARVVGMLTGCVQREFFPRVNAATARVLAMEGCDVVIPREQGCCGALSVHNGREPEAIAFARRTIDVFDAAGVQHVVVNAAGCGSSMKEYAELLRDDPAYADRAARFAGAVRDVSELLAELGPVAERHPLPVTRGLPRRLPPRARAGGAGATARPAARRSPGSSCARSPTPTSAAARPGSTTCCSRRPPASWASARRGPCWPPAPSCW